MIISQFYFILAHVSSLFPRRSLFRYYFHSISCFNFLFHQNWEVTITYSHPFNCEYISTCDSFEIEICSNICSFNNIILRFGPCSFWGVVFCCCALFGPIQMLHCCTTTIQCISSFIMFTSFRIFSRQLIRPYTVTMVAHYMNVLA